MERFIPLALATDEVQGVGTKGDLWNARYSYCRSRRAADAATDACNYDSDNAKIMFQSRTHNLEFQLIGEKPENSNIYVVYMQFFFSRQNPAC